MSDIVIERTRTGWDIVLGLLLIVAGVIILGHTVIATAFSVLFIGWVALIFGVVTIVVALFGIGREGFWPTILSGALLAVLGLVFVRNPGVAAVTLTLVAGALFFVGGITRIALAFAQPEYRWILIISGIAGVVLGVIVLFNIATATLVLLGTLLGIEAIIDGVSTLVAGRVRVRQVGATEAAAS